MVILGISQISHVSREGWLLKVHSEQDHFPSSEEPPDKEVEFKELELLLVDGWVWLGMLQETETGRRFNHSNQYQITLNSIIRYKKAQMQSHEFVGQIYEYCLISIMKIGEHHFLKPIWINITRCFYLIILTNWKIQIKLENALLA